MAATCFDEVPEYQCLTGRREDLEDKVIVTARDASGRLIGFCSAILLDVPALKCLHLGLTCVTPEARSLGLTHALTSRVVVGTLLREAPLGRLWITNVACVLSSLGNVARHFEDVFPSPHGPRTPSFRQMRIARRIDTHYRRDIAIAPDAVLDTEAFVFRGSVPGTVFEKDADDVRFHHRDASLTDFYRSRMDFSAGDEVVQVGSVTLLTWPRYQLRRLAERLLPVRVVKLFRTRDRARLGP